MKLEPSSLDIPLERKNHVLLVTICACVLCVAITALVAPEFSQAFAATCVVGLPVLLVFLSPSAFITRYFAVGRWTRWLVYLVLFSYVVLAKRVLLPALLSLFAHLFR
jgi:hypothetical protein